MKLPVLMPWGRAVALSLMLVPALSAQQVADTQFSSDRGFYELPFDVLIATATPGATVRYTLDGSDPRTSTNFAEGASPQLVRVDPLSTNGGLRVLTPAVTLRAYAYMAGMTDTNVDTHTYVFANEVVGQVRPSGYPTSFSYDVDPNVVNDPRYTGRIVDDLKSLPAVSIVMPRDDMFGSNGVYNAPASSIEKEGSLEVVYPNGRKGEQANCGFRPHSHILRKRSLRVYFRAAYGATKLKHALFRDAVEGRESSVDRFDRLVLRAGVNDNLQAGWDGRNGRATYLTDTLARSSQTAMSGYGSRGVFVHLYINGLYWGLYNPVERPDEGFTSEYFGGAKVDWFAVNHGGVLGGDPVNYNGVFGNLNDWTQLKRRVDIEAFCDYILYYCYSGGGDWPWNNWYAGVRNLPTAGKLRFFVWDCEDSWILMTNRANDGAWIHPDLLSSSSPISRLWGALDDIEEFRVIFGDRVYRHCFNDGVLTEANIKARWDELSAGVDGGIVGESARWGRFKYGGGLWTRDDNWIPFRDSVRNLMTGNVQQLIGALRNVSVPSSHPRYYPTIDPPLFKDGIRVLEVTRGTVNPGFQLTLERDGNVGTIYYTVNGRDPRAAGGGVQGINAGTSATLAVQRNTLVKARTKDGNEWSALHEIELVARTAPVRIEIHELLADNATGMTDEAGDADDWIELLNRGVESVDLTGYHLTDDLLNPTKWAFPAGTVVPSGETLIVWADNSSQGPMHANFRLSATGETLGLYDPMGALVDTIAFGAQAEDVSMGRMVHASGMWATFTAPTPGRPNEAHPCGHLAYHGVDSTRTLFELEGRGVPVVNTQAAYKVKGAPANSPGFIGLSLRSRSLDLGALGVLLTDPVDMAVVVADINGEADFALSLPDNPIWKGQTLFVQAIFWNGFVGGFSNGVSTRICR